MGSLATERNVLEEGLNVIKQANLEFASPVSEMYEALQRQYTQVRTIKLQGKAQDYVKKVLHDSKFFCILTKLITQAIGQSRTAKQQNTNIQRVHKWYTTNIHKLHFAEQPAFRTHSPDPSIRRIDRVPSSKQFNKVPSPKQSSSPSTRKASIVSVEPATDTRPNTRKQQELEDIPTRPKSVTWREPRQEDEASGSEEAETDNQSESRATTSELVNSKSLDMVHSISGRSTPYYNRVDDSSYIDTVLTSNQIEDATPRYNSPVNRTFTPVVHEYIEQIQREVNKVQGHPSDLYPELFTPHIVNAIISENQELKPAGRLKSAENGNGISEQSTEQFFDMADRYRPNTVKKFAALQPRKGQTPRPKSSISLSYTRSTSTPQTKPLQMKDVVSLVDFASAEISYEKEAGIRATLHRPKTSPASISQRQIEASPPAAQEESSMLAILPAESAGSPTASQSHTSVVDWRGKVTPNCSDSQQEVFKSHSYARRSARLSGAKGRSVGSTSAGFRPRTAPVTLHSLGRADQITPSENNERIPQAASNTLMEVDNSTTKSLLKVSNMKSSAPKRHKVNNSTEEYGNYYMEYISSKYAAPPCSIYEYTSYPYEYEPLPKSYQFMEDDKEDRAPSPQNVEYLTIVNSIAPDLDRLRKKSKHETRVERANTPASSVKTKDSSPSPPDPMIMVAANEGGAGDSTHPGSTSDQQDKQLAEVDESFESKRQKSRMELIKSLVPSPMFQFSAYPTPNGSVLRVRSPGRPKTIVTAKDNHSSGLEKAVTAITFEPPFDAENFRKSSQKTKSVGKLRSSTDKSSPLVQPLRSAPSIPSVHGTYGCRSPRLSRSQPYSGEHDRSAHRQLNPVEYLKKVRGMRAEDVYFDEEENEPAEELSVYLDVRPMSSRLDFRPNSSDLKAIKFDGERVESPAEYLCTSPAFITESNDGERVGSPAIARCQSGRPKSSKSTASSRPQSSRPIPQYMKTESWEKTTADSQRLKEAAAAVSIQKIFRGYVSRKVYLNLKRDYRTEQENKRSSAITIQRSWRQHQSRLNSIYSKPAVSADTLQWAQEFKSVQQQSKIGREVKRESENQIVKKQGKDSKERLSTIGPHVEVYSAYHPPKTGATKKEIEKAVVIIQKHVRGRQCRQYMDIIKEKAKDHSSSWAEWVSYYKRFLKKILHRRGIDKPEIEINLEQMKKFMSQKKRYESVFDRRAFGGELEEDEFGLFFKECDLMPANHEIEHSIDLVFKGKPRSKKTTFKKREVLDIVFEIYKPEGTGMANDRKSTWLHPIVDGEDAMKMLGTDMVEPTPLGPCIQLVANSMRERRERAEEEERLRVVARQSRLGRCSGDLSNDNERKDISVSTHDEQQQQPTLADDNNNSTGNANGTDNANSTDNQQSVKIFSSEPLVAPK